VSQKGKSVTSEDGHKPAPEFESEKSMSAIYSSVQLTIMTCGNCGVEFAIPENMRAEKELSGGHWYCPNGHQRVYTETEAARYKRLYEKEQREAASFRELKLAAERAQEKAEKKLAQHKKRAAAGVCPCCKRTFSQLSKHMQSKHSDFMELQGLTPRKQLPEKVQ
jgi:hypothetical protein